MLTYEEQRAEILASLKQPAKASSAPAPKATPAPAPAPVALPSGARASSLDEKAQGQEAEYTRNNPPKPAPIGDVVPRDPKTGMRVAMVEVPTTTQEGEDMDLRPLSRPVADVVSKLSAAGERTRGAEMDLPVSAGEDAPAGARVRTRPTARPESVITAEEAERERTKADAWSPTVGSLVSQLKDAYDRAKNADEEGFRGWSRSEGKISQDEKLRKRFAAEEGARRAADEKEKRETAEKATPKIVLPDEERVRELATNVFHEGVDFGKGDSKQKAIRTYLERRRDQLLEQWGYTEPAKDEEDMRRKRDMPGQAVARAEEDLVSLSREGVLPFSITHTDVSDLPDNFVGDAIAMGRAILPQTVMTPGGQNARTESIGMWALGTMSIPEYLTVAGLHDDVDALHAIANRTDIPTYKIEHDPEIQADLLSGDSERVSRAVARLVPYFILSVAMPDPTSLAFGAGEVAGLGADAARIQRRLTQVVKDAHAAGENPIAAIRAAAAADRKVARAEAVGVLGSDLAAHMERTKNPEAAAKAMEAKQKTPLLDKAAKKAGVGGFGEATDASPAAVAQHFRENTLRHMNEDGDVAAYLDETNQNSTAKGFPEKWEDLKYTDEDIETAREALGEEPDPHDVARLERQEAALRGQAKLGEVYTNSGRRAAEEIKRSLWGETPTPRKAPPPPTPPRETPDVEKVFGGKVSPERAAALAKAADDPRAFVDELSKASKDVQAAVATRLVGGDPTTAMDRLRTLVRTDTAAMGTRVAQAQKDAADAAKRVRDLKDRITLLKTGPENAEKLRLAREALDAAEKRFVAADRALKEANAAAPKSSPEAPEVGALRRNIEKMKARLEEMQKETPSDMSVAERTARAELEQAQQELDGLKKALDEKAAEASKAEPVVEPVTPKAEPVVEPVTPKAEPVTPKAEPVVPSKPTSTTALGKLIATLEQLGETNITRTEGAGKVLGFLQEQAKKRGMSALDYLREFDAFDPVEAEARAAKLEETGDAAGAAKLRKTIQAHAKYAKGIEERALALQEDADKAARVERTAKFSKSEKERTAKMTPEERKADRQAKDKYAKDLHASAIMEAQQAGKTAEEAKAYADKKVKEALGGKTPWVTQKAEPVVEAPVPPKAEPVVEAPVPPKAEPVVEAPVPPKAEPVVKTRAQPQGGTGVEAPTYTPDGKISPASLEKAVHGRRGADVLDYLVKHTKNPAYKKIAERLRAHVLNNTTVTVVQVGDTAPSMMNIAKGLAVTGPRKSEVWLRGTSFAENGVSEETLLHELIHIATQERILAGNLRKNQGTELYDAVQELYRLQNDIVPRIAQYAKDNNIPEEVKWIWANAEHPTEMVTYGLTHPVYQDILKKIKINGESAWSRFVSGVARLLGVQKSEKTALGELIAITDRILAAPHDQLGVWQQQIGKMAATADEPTFKAWTENLPVAMRWDDIPRDGSGFVAKVYHGTPTPGHDTLIPRTGVATGSGQALSGEGVYLSTEAAEATRYAGDEGGVYPLFVKVSKPFIRGSTTWGDRAKDIARRYMTDLVSERYAQGKMGSLENGSFLPDVLPPGTITQMLRADGYDGVVDGHIVVSLDGGDKIKSAVGNRGTFDPNDPRISFAKAKTPTAAADEPAELTKARAKVEKAQKKLDAVLAREAAAKESKRAEVAGKVAVARKLLDEEQAKLDVLVKQDTARRAAEDAAAAQGSKDALAAAQKEHAAASNVLAGARVDRAKLDDLKVPSDRARLALPELEGKVPEAEAAAAKRQAEADGLARALGEHPQKLGEVQQKLAAEKPTFADAAGKMGPPPPAAPPAAAPEFDVLPAGDTRTILRHIRREQILAERNKSWLSKRLAAAGDRAKRYFVPSRATVLEGLTDAQAQAVRVYDGNITMWEREIARATDTLDPRAEEMHPHIQRVLGTRTQDIRTALASSASQSFADRVALAFIPPSQAGKLPAEALEDLRGIVRDWSNGSEDARALRDTLLERTRYWQGRVPDVTVYPPQVGDILLANAAANATATHAFLVAAGDAGAVVGASTAKMANEVSRGYATTAEGRRALARTLMDPSRYSDVTTPTSKVLGTKTLDDIEKAQRTPFVAAPGGARLEEGARAIEQGLGVVDEPIFVPRVMRDRIAARIEAVSATAEIPHHGVSSGKLLTNYYKQSLTSGMLSLRPTYMFNNWLGDTDQAMAMLGLRATARSQIPTIINTLILSGAIPTPTDTDAGVAGAAVVLLGGVALQMPVLLRLLDYAAKTPRAPGTALRALDELLAGANLGNGRIVSKVLEGPAAGADEMITIGKQQFRLSELHAAAVRSGVVEGLITQDATRSLDQAMQARRARGLMRPLVWTERATRDTADLIASRRKAGLFVELIRGGATPDQAGKIVEEVLYNYPHTLHPFERTMFMDIMRPFWVFEKNNFHRTWKAFTQPEKWTTRLFGVMPVTPGYRIKAWHKVKQDVAQVATAYFDSTDEYGYDVNSMREEPDPTTLMRVAKEMQAADPTLSASQAHDAAWALFEQGDERIPPASDRYLRLIEDLKGQGLSWEEIRGEHLIDQLGDDYKSYYAPDPVREMLPAWAQGRYTVWLGLRRSQRITQAQTQDNKDASYDDQAYIAFAPDATGDALGKAAMALMMAANLPTWDAATGPRLVEGGKEILGDPLGAPAPRILLSAMAGYAKGDLRPGASLSERVGEFMYAAYPGSVSRRVVQKGPDEVVYTYTVTPEGEMPMYFLGLVSQTLLTENQAGLRSESMGTGGAFSAFTGQSVRTTTPGARARGDRYAAVDRIRAQTPDSTKLSQVPIDEQSRRARQQARETMGSPEVEKQRILSLRQGITDPRDYGVARQIAVTEGLYPEATVDQMTDADVANKVVAKWRAALAPPAPPQ